MVNQSVQVFVRPVEPWCVNKVHQLFFFCKGNSTLELLTAIFEGEIKKRFLKKKTEVQTESFFSFVWVELSVSLWLLCSG